MSRLACLVLLGVALTACSRTHGADHGADRSTAPLAVEAPPATIQKVALEGDELVAHVGANAKKLVESWRPLAFNGELKPYDPEDWNFAFNRLVDDACRSNAVWGATAAFKDGRMGEIPTAVSTPDGPVLYERVWEKYSGEDREIYVGVRTSDRACGAFNLASGTLKVSGDGDVVAALVAAFAIRKVDREADQRTLTSQTRYAARENVSALLPAVSNATPTQTEASAKAVRPYDLELIWAGVDSNLSFPLEASYRVNTQNSTWWICFSEDDCGEPQKATSVSPRSIVFERTADTSTVWSAETGRLDSIDPRIGMRRHLNCRFQRPKGKQG